MTTYLSELPDDAVVVHHPRWPHPAPVGEHGLIELSRLAFEHIDEYDRSVPTAPSAGRVYRRGSTVFIVADDPDDPRWQYHHPHLALPVDP